MTEKQQIGTWGTVSLTVTLVITKMLISAPSLFAKQSASAGWIEILISGVFEIFILAIILKLAENYEGMDIIDIAEATFGKMGKFICGFFSCVVFIVSAAAVFRCFCELIRNTVIRGIGYEDVSFFMLAAAITGAYLGTRTLVSSAGIFLPFIIAAITLVMLINIPRYSISNILPVFGTGLKVLTKNALLKNSSFFEIGIILYFLPYFKEKTSVKKICFTGLILSIFLSSLITLLYQLTVPYEAAGTFALPLYQMTRMIKSGTFFQRIEPLNVFMWGSAMYTYVGVGVRMAAYTYKKTFSLTHAKPLVFVFGYIISLLALIPGSETSVERIYDFLMTYSYIAYPLLPLLLFVTGAVFHKNRKRCSIEA